MPSPIDEILNILDDFDEKPKKESYYTPEVNNNNIPKELPYKYSRPSPQEETPAPPRDFSSSFMNNVAKRAQEAKLSKKRVNSRFSSEAADMEIMKLIGDKEDKILVIGVGGAGSNAVSRLTRRGIKGAVTVAANTDAFHLLNSVADQKIVLGKELTEGLGAGNDPVIGRAAAEESTEDIRELVRGADMVFIQAGMGGGTGTGAASVIADIARSEGALVVGVCTLPFEMEGEERVHNALEGLKELYSTCDTVIVIPNQKLLQIDPTLPIDMAFKIADEILIKAVQGIVNLVTTPAYVNVDFADIRQILKRGGSSVIGVGEGEGPDRIEDALRESLAYSLLDIQIMDAKAALIHIAGGETLSLEEIQRCVRAVTNEIGKDAHIIWGTHIDKSLGSKVEVTIILSGVDSPYSISFDGIDPNQGWDEEGFELQSPPIKTIWDI